MYTVTRDRLLRSVTHKHWRIGAGTMIIFALGCKACRDTLLFFLFFFLLSLILSHYNLKEKRRLSPELHPIGRQA